MKINGVSPVENKPQTTVAGANAKVPSFGSKFGKIGKIARDNFTQLGKAGPMPRGMFVANAFVFLLGSRLLTARDKDEKREIFIRDVPTIALSVLGVPMFEKAAGAIIKRTTGFSVGDKYNVLENWYQNGKTMTEKGKTIVKNGKTIIEKGKDTIVNATGIKEFSNRLIAQGADLKKVYSTLTPEIKTALSGVEGNEKVLEKMVKDKKVSEAIQAALRDSKNAALNKAFALKTVTKALGFGLTLGLIGILIPKINIEITKSIHKNDKAKVAENTTNNEANKVA